MPFSLIPFLLLIVPIMEIAAFIVIGGQIGVFPTLGLIVVTAIIGSILLRVQGLGLLARIQNDLRENKVPARELVHGLMIAIAGVLLLTPGFVTDTCGFLLFVPQIRDAAWHFAKSRVTVASMSGATFHESRYNRQNEGQKGPTIDLDEEDYAHEPNADSPWSDQDQKN